MSARSWFSCWTCHGTGKHKVKEIIHRSEWTPMMRAEHILEGGYFYNLVDEPCPKGYKASEQSPTGERPRSLGW